MLNIDDFLHSIPFIPSNLVGVVKTSAELIATYQQQLQSQQITQDEFNELCQDALSLDKIDQLTQNVQERELLSQAFNILMSLASKI